MHDCPLLTANKMDKKTVSETEMAESHLLKYRNVRKSIANVEKLTSTFVLTAVYTYKLFCLSTRQTHCFQAALLVITVTASI